MLRPPDPEVSTLNNVTNIQNSLFIPSLGRFINRRPTYNLTRAPGRDATGIRPTPAGGPPRDGFQQGPRIEDQDYEFNFNHAILPDGVSLDGWTKDEMAELNDHVRHMLHSRRNKFKRTMKAFGKYVQKPLGLFVTVYATLLTLFGLAWVLFLIGWIYVGEKQLYVIFVIDSVLVALFGLVGDLLIPFRLVDTYHMLFIAHYHRKTWKRRKQLQMAKLRDKNDLPTDPELEAARDEVSVLNEIEQATLVHHQNKFATSHTFYRPHETKTHYAFPQSFLIAIVLLLDLHSALQVSLGVTTWRINWKTRPAAITATILSVSITVNITAGILISIGGEADAQEGRRRAHVPAGPDARGSQGDPREWKEGGRRGEAGQGRARHRRHAQERDPRRGCQEPRARARQLRRGPRRVQVPALQVQRRHPSGQSRLQVVTVPVKSRRGSERPKAVTRIPGIQPIACLAAVAETVAVDLTGSLVVCVCGVNNPLSYFFVYDV